VIEHIHPDGEPTPTVRELYERKDGSAEATVWVTPKGGETPVPTKFRLLPKGQAIITGIAQRNAAATLARNSAGEEGVAAMVKSRLEGGSESGSKGKPTPS